MIWFLLNNSNVLKIDRNKKQEGKVIKQEVLTLMQQIHQTVKEVMWK